MTETAQDEQPALLPPPARARQALAAARRTTRPPATPEVVAAELPVARVLVDVPLAHLDRPFDYLVPEGLDQKVRPGSR
ncbi:MAG TPA: hypothetical protein VFY14_19835, partial [Streptomyces sp.]|nr:hypothetical protein [Streptomyces sp.]